MSQDAMRAKVQHYSRLLTSFLSSPDPFRILHSREAAPRPHGSGEERVLVLDSSFNPPTRAHSHMARSAVRHSPPQNTRLLLLLAVHNADKLAGQPAALPERLVMMDALAGIFDVHVDVGVTKLPYFHEKARVIPGDKVFLVGYDTAVRMFDDKYYADMAASLTDFFQNAELRVTLRPGQWGTREEQQAWVARKAQEWGRITVDEGEEGQGVSSSEVRRLIGDGEEARDLVDQAVWHVIQSLGLFSNL